MTAARVFYFVFKIEFQELGISSVDHFHMIDEGMQEPYGFLEMKHVNIQSFLVFSINSFIAKLLIKDYLEPRGHYITIHLDFSGRCNATAFRRKVLKEIYSVLFFFGLCRVS